MALACAECGRSTVDRRYGGAHWLCAAHRKQRGLDATRGACVVREADLMRTLVFDFPLDCDHDEAMCRARFAARTCTSDDRVRAVVRAYRIRSTRVSRGIERGDVVEFFERLALFMCACVPSSHSQLALLAGQWYPVLAGSCGMERIARAERVLLAVERATGTREFLVRSDLAPLCTRVPSELVDMVYSAYIACIQRGGYHDERRTCRTHARTTV
jgi:hypothetical protein